MAIPRRGDGVTGRTRESCGEEFEVGAKAKGGGKVRKEFDAKGDKAGNEKRPRYVRAKAR